jgi:tRNA dimethylallyltransferase
VTEASSVSATRESTRRAGRRVVAVLGPTASGKSKIALDVAEAAGDVELVSVDSMAVYRGMDIGTAKPTPTARIQGRYHLLDLVTADQEFTVTQFQRAARETLSDIDARGNRALLVGGTGLYLRSVVDDLTFPGRFPHLAASLWAEVEAAGPEDSDGRQVALARLHAQLSALDPVAAGRIEASNGRRLVRALEVTLGSGRPFSSFGPGLERYPPSDITLVGVRVEIDVLDRRIAERFAQMMDEGLLAEVKRLAAAPNGVSRTARQALGYRELLAHVEEGLPLDGAVELAVQRTRAFARRQMAWFRRDPRIVWLDPDDDPVSSIVALLGGIPLEGASMGDWRVPR